MTHEHELDKSSVKKQKQREEGLDKGRPAIADQDKTGLTGLQKAIGNQAVQRLLAQREGEGPTELDDETAGRINQARGGGQALDAGVQESMSAASGQDFSGVRVHTSPEANELSQQLSAKAFTTGQDVFFRQGAYDPHSSSGQELIAHELTHVAQQASGQVSSPGGGMTVNPPGDHFEQEADSLAKSMTAQDAAPAAVQQVQRHEAEALQPQDTEGTLQTQLEEDEEPVQTQVEEPEEEEEPIQTQLEEEEPEAVQRQEELPEEEF